MATAAFWSEGGQRWHTGSAKPPTGEPDADGAEELFELILNDGPQALARFAHDYLETSPIEAAISAVYQSKPLDPPIVAALNPDAEYEDVRKQLDAKGLPRRGSSPRTSAASTPGCRSWTLRWPRSRSSMVPTPHRARA